MVGRLRRQGQEVVHGSTYSRGEVRVLWRDEAGTPYVRWYGRWRLVELVELADFPKDGMRTKRYVIQ